jgi:nitric oxide reductase NorQ protein
MGYSNIDKAISARIAASNNDEVGSNLIDPRPTRGFVRTAHVRELTNRALGYLRAGFPVHFRGPTGTGKTTLALHLASRLRQPVSLIHGDDQFTSTDLTGKDNGFQFKRSVDEFVRGVSKFEESMTKKWADHRLTAAVRHGYTLLYDEFTRSRPEANNILLAVLQEGVLDFPVGGAEGESFLKVHPDFKIIFTSNPEEYAGVHKTQDALLDRMITIDIGHYDFDTEVRITRVKSRLQNEDAQKIVQIARALRAEGKFGYLPTIRGCIMVAKSTKQTRGAEVSYDSPAFHQVCHDVFISEMARHEDQKGRARLIKRIDELISEYCGKRDEHIQDPILNEIPETQGAAIVFSAPEHEDDPLRDLTAFSSQNYGERTQAIS